MHLSSVQLEMVPRVRGRTDGILYFGYVYSKVHGNTSVVGFVVENRTEGGLKGRTSG